MTGQEAVNVALAFQERVAFDGVILTKLDGDARGGAALSVRAVTGRPVKLVSVGEKLDQLEYFHPDRMASRILGMGDVMTLIEKAEAAVEVDDQAEMEKRIRAGEFTFDDFLASYRMLRKMGPLQGVMKLVPGMGKQMQGLDLDERQLARVEAIVLSMTPHERRMPHVISMQRRRRIAAGSGTSLDEVNKLMAARKQMAKMMKQMGKGKMPTLPPGLRAARGASLPSSSTRKAHTAHGSEDQIDAGRLEEEPDLPRRRGRLALPARRSLHRDRRSLQPADRSVHDRPRRGEDQGLDGEGRAAHASRCRGSSRLPAGGMVLRSGREAAGFRDPRGRIPLSDTALRMRWPSFSSGSRVGWSTSPTRARGDGDARGRHRLPASMSRRTTSAR